MTQDQRNSLRRWGIPAAQATMISAILSFVLWLAQGFVTTPNQVMAQVREVESRVSAVEKSTNDRLARIETKLDIIADALKVKDEAEDSETRSGRNRTGREESR